MPLFKNISKSHLFLPREDGLKPDIELLPDRTFNGSEAFYNKFVGSPEFLLERQTEGYVASSTVETGPDRVEVDVEGFMTTNGIVASSDDATINSEVSAGTEYSAFGLFTWQDGFNGITYSAYFSVIGDGDHGSANESTFSFSATSPGGSSQEPQESGSSISIDEGKMTISMDAGDTYNPIVQIIYEKAAEGQRLIDQVNKILNGPNLTTSYTYVLAGDTPSPNYVNGSEGLIKTEKVYSTGSKVGDRAKEITYYYQDSTNATQVTHKIERISSVEISDLP